MEQTQRDRNMNRKTIKRLLNQSMDKDLETYRHWRKPYHPKWRGSKTNQHQPQMQSLPVKLEPIEDGATVNHGHAVQMASESQDLAKAAMKLSSQMKIGSPMSPTPNLQNIQTYDPFMGTLLTTTDGTEIVQLDGTDTPPSEIQQVPENSRQECIPEPINPELLNPPLNAGERLMAGLNFEPDWIRNQGQKTMDMGLMDSAATSDGLKQEPIGSHLPTMQTISQRKQGVDLNAILALAIKGQAEELKWKYANTNEQCLEIDSGDQEAQRRWAQAKKNAKERKENIITRQQDVLLREGVIDAFERHFKRTQKTPLKSIPEKSIKKRASQKDVKEDKYQLLGNEEGDEDDAWTEYWRERNYGGKGKTIESENEVQAGTSLSENDKKGDNNSQKIDYKIRIYDIHYNIIPGQLAKAFNLALRKMEKFDADIRDGIIIGHKQYEFQKPKMHTTCKVIEWYLDKIEKLGKDSNRERAEKLKMQYVEKMSEELRSLGKKARDEHRIAITLKNWYERHADRFAKDTEKFQELMERATELYIQPEVAETKYPINFLGSVSLNPEKDKEEAVRKTFIERLTCRARTCLKWW